LQVIHEVSERDRINIITIVNYLLLIEALVWVP
jgi:hypothetical protein